MTNAHDILSRLSNQPQVTARGTRMVKRWRVYSCGRWTSRIHPYAQARKIVARLLRRGVDAYMSPMMVREQV